MGRQSAALTLCKLGLVYSWDMKGDCLGMKISVLNN